MESRSGGRWFGILVLLLILISPALADDGAGAKKPAQQQQQQRTDVGQPVPTPIDYSRRLQVPLMQQETKEKDDDERVPERFDNKQALVDQALAILKTIDEGTSKSRRKSQAVGLFTRLLQLFKQFILLHKAKSLEEPADGSLSKDANPTARKLRMAVEALETAAQSNNGDALMLLGDMNFYGNWTYPRNYTVAFKKYKQLADVAGNSTAQHMVAFMYATGVGDSVRRDQGMALLYHTFAALGGDSRSEMTLGYRYRFGIGTPRNCEESSFYYKRVADKAMQYWLSGPPGGRFMDLHAYRLADEEGGVYGQGASASSSGHNAKRRGLASADSASDLYDILDYWEMMAAKEDLMSIYGLGKLYYDGSRVLTRNFARARHYFMLLANMYWDAKGQPLKKIPPSRKGLEKFAARAAGQLGKMYMRGDGVKQNFETAIRWFKRGIAQGDQVSQNGLGYMYLHGLGVQKDLLKAFEFFKMAAEQHFGPAQCNLGKLIYAKGDRRLAVEYYEAAAKQGVLEAMYLLGEYYNGPGNQHSCPHASAYYKTVAEKMEPIHSPLGWAMEAYGRGDLENAAVGFMMGSEMGYESAQANAAWLLDPEKQMFSFTKWLAKQIGKPITEKPSQIFNNRSDELTLAYWTRSAKQQNIDSFVKLGDYYYKGIGTDPDYEKALGCYQVASAFQQSAQALWNIGYMYENGIGLKQDFHLAKRYYDQALQANQEAYLPVTLSLLRLRIRSFWNTITGGSAVSIGADDDEDAPSSRTLLEQLFNLRPNIAHPPGRAGDENDDMIPDDPEDFDRDVHPEGEGMDDYDDENDYFDIGNDDDIVESFVILMLVAMAGLLIWYRQQRRIGEERQGQPGGAAGAGPLPNFGWGAPLP